ncbi:MAG TPA: type II toxin-antitoxin system prevent-host-death family antitoxin [Candidatus Acidoferrum sp.]
MPKRISRPKKKSVAERAPSRPSSAEAWQLQTAKARFSELFRRTLSEGPQRITRQDKEAVVMLTAEEFANLTARANQPRSLVQFFAESPLAKASIDLERKPDYGRPVDL